MPDTGTGIGAPLITTGSDSSFAPESEITPSMACGLWASEDEMCSPCNNMIIDDPMMQEALAAASDTLFLLSGRQFPGVCSSLVRPCARRVAGGVQTVSAWGGYSWYSSSDLAYGWRSGLGCSCQAGQSCGCDGPDAITLGGYPLVAVEEVKVDGAVLDPSTYRVDDQRYLVRLPDEDGSRPGWPCCQDVALPDSEPGTWSVRFSYGKPPPIMGVRAAAALACQLALACSPETAGMCQLPRRVTSVSRQGVSAVLIDNMDPIKEGWSGIAEVDMFIRSTNPNKLVRPSGVLSPDIGRRVIRADT